VLKRMTRKRAGQAPRSAGVPCTGRRAVFTIVSSNYIAYAATLMQSARAHLPGVERYIILADTRRAFPDIDLPATLLDCDEIQLEHVDNMKKWYTVIEFNTAIKPSVFLYLFQHLGFEAACYIDPDILLFSGMSEVFTALRDHSCVLTPHMMQPLQDGKEPSDLTIMKSGVYNLGFFGLRNDHDGCRLAKWWADRCFLNCRVDIAGNMFTDQRWMDLAPAFVSRPFILRHPGYNVAYWNLLHRKVKKTDTGQWRVNGERLVFFHFSGISPDKPGQFSKHQDRYTSENLGVVNDLCDHYRALVLTNHWKKYTKSAYGFANFADGRRIDDVMRHSLARSIDEGRIDPKAKLLLPSDFFDRPADAAAKKGVVISRYMYQLWLDRRDLRAAFDIFTPDGLEHYYNWFLEGDAARQGVEARSIAAARKFCKVAPAPQPAALALRLPPWPRVASEAWADTSIEALDALADDIVIDGTGRFIRIPKQIALLWERRRDLQSAFNLDLPGRLHDYLCWAITHGIRDGALDVGCLSPLFVQDLLNVSSVSAYYDDVPITEAMILLRHVAERRDFLHGWQRFPVERTGRLAHGLWFAFVAPKLFPWLDGIVAPVRDYFLQPTQIEIDGFSLNRAVLSVWELRTDLHHIFPLSDRLAAWRYLRWLLMDGLGELDLPINSLDPRLRSFLRAPSPRFPGVTQLLEMLHDFRADLRQLYDLKTSAGQMKIVEWAKQHLLSETKSLALQQALREPEAAPAASPLALATCHATLCLTGYWAAPSGRGEDVRGSASALDAVGYTDYVVVDLETKSVRWPNGEILPPGTPLDVDVNIVHTNADTAFEDAIALRRLGVRSGKSVGYWAWELEWLPDYWRHAYSFYDEIWASTRFAQAAFEVDALRPVKLVPMAVVKPDIHPEMSRTELALPETATLFLFMFDYRSYVKRKNPEAVIRAFREAFPAGDEAAYLLIKTSGAGSLPGDAASLHELAADPRIELRDARLERAELCNIIRAADAFVSLHRSEGFGRGPAEAMLLGVPVIVTDYSGSTDYATSETALLVDYELIPVSEYDYPGATGQRWADANTATAARQMRWVYENRKAARALGRRGHEQISSMYGTRSVGEFILRSLGIPPTVAFSKKITKTHMTRLARKSLVGVAE
jgi:glycosyltransferase involved in cell wall biosynthesis